MTRKVSEVLLDMESRQQRMAGLLQNIDNNIKLILDKLNKQSNPSSAHVSSTPVMQASPIVAKPVVKQTQQAPPPQRQQSTVVYGEDPDAPPTNISRPQQKFVGQPVTEQPYGLDDYGQPELMEEVVRKGKRRDLRKPADASQTKKIAVSQQIALADGKPMFLANVEIFDETEKLVKQTRTNSSGRWLASLDPGQYTVHILKRPTGENKKPVEMRFQVKIPDSDGPVVLPSPELEE